MGCLSSQPLSVSLAEDKNFNNLRSTYRPSYRPSAQGYIQPLQHLYQMADRILEGDEKYKKELFENILASRDSKDQAVIIKASESITILNLARVSFSGMNLSKIQIPGAKLNQAIMYNTELDSANLSGVDFSKAYLSKASMEGANISYARFGLYDSFFTNIEGSYFIDTKFSPDRRSIACTDAQGIIKIWDVARRKFNFSLVEHKGHQILSTTFSPDGVYLISTATDKKLIIWNVRKGLCERILEDNETQIECADVSNNGRALAICDRDSTLQIFELENLQRVNYLKQIEVKNQFYNIKFSPNGEYIATACLNHDGHVINLWKAPAVKQFSFEWNEEDSLVETFTQHSAHILFIHFHLEDKKLYSLSKDGELVIWDLLEGLALGSFMLDHDEKLLNAARMNKDYSLIVTCGEDNTIKLWDNTGTWIETLCLLDEEVVDVDFSYDGRMIIASTIGGNVKTWYVDDENYVRPSDCEEQQITSIDISNDGKKALIGNIAGCLNVWDLEKGKIIKTIDNGHHSAIEYVQYTPDGKKFCSTAKDKKFIIWNEENNNVEDVIESDDTLFGIDISKDSKFAIVQKGYHQIKIIDLTTYNAVDTLKIYPGEIESAKFLYPECKQVVCCGTFAGVQIYDIDTKKLTKEISLPDSQCTSNLQISTDGKMIAFSDENLVIHVYQVEDFESLCKIDSYKTRINSINFSADNQKIVVGCQDNSIRIFDPDFGYLLFTIELDQPVRNALFGPSSDIIVSINFDKSIKVFQFSPPEKWIMTKYITKNPYLCLKNCEMEGALSNQPFLLTYEEIKNKPNYMPLVGGSGSLVESVHSQNFITRLPTVQSDKFEF